MPAARKQGRLCASRTRSKVQDGTTCRSQSPTRARVGDPWEAYEFAGMPADATYVCMQAAAKFHFIMPPADLFAETDTDLTAEALSWFADKLRALDKALKGNATQSWGMIIFGKGTGEGSTATKAAPGAKIWSSSFDFKEFMDILELVIDVHPRRYALSRDTRRHAGCVEDQRP